MRTSFVFCCLLYVALAKKAEISVEGFEGGKVAFRCPHKLAHAYSKYFCKDSCKGSDILATVESGRQTKSGRITLADGGDGAFTVVFQRLQLSDSGMYWCAVDRPGLDTYTSINLTVHKVAATNAPVVSSTWTQNIFNTTRLTHATKTNTQSKLITVTSAVRYEQKTNPSPILYVALGAVGTFIILILAMVFKKRRETAKPQPPIFFNSKDPDNIHIKKMCWPHQEQHPVPSACTGNNSNVPLHVYENITFSKSNKGSRDPLADQQNQDTTSRIYITLLPSATPEKTDDDSKHTIKSTGNESPVTSEASAPPCVTNKETPASLWFGLDISKINQS